VVGTDRKISLFETAQRATAMGDSLDSTGKLDTPLTFPNGCHIAEIEIDPDTASSTRHVYGGGRLRNIQPDVVEGQVQGSIANGLGQALTETRSTIQ